MKTLIIIGAGGHAKVVADCAEKIGEYDAIYCLDEVYPEKQHLLHWSIVGKSADWVKYKDEADFIVAIGNNHTRYRIANEIIEQGGNLVSLIHPSAQISDYASIDVGTVVFANAVINCEAQIGIAGIINTGATVDHDCKLGKACHISPGANIAGIVTIGDFSWLGIGASVIQCVNIAENVHIGAGAAVTQDLASNSLYVGVPAKRIKTLN